MNQWAVPVRETNPQIPLNIRQNIKVINLFSGTTVTVPTGFQWTILSGQISHNTGGGDSKIQVYPPDNFPVATGNIILAYILSACATGIYPIGSYALGATNIWNFDFQKILPSQFTLTTGGSPATSAVDLVILEEAVQNSSIS